MPTITKISDVLLNTDVIDPYSIANHINQPELQNKTYRAYISNELQMPMSEIIKDNNYFNLDIAGNKLDRYNTLFNHNIKLKQEIDRIQKQITTLPSTNKHNSSQELYNELSTHLIKAIHNSNIENKKLVSLTNKEQRELKEKKQLLEREIEYNIKDIHLRNTVLKYIRLVLYILGGILLVLAIINYIK